MSCVRLKKCSKMHKIYVHNIITVFFVLFFFSNDLLVAKQESVIYKKIGKDSLYIYFFYPRQTRNSGLPAVVFFHGGAWTKGEPKQFFPQCKTLVKFGIVCASVEYRTKLKFGTDPKKSVEDAVSAISYIYDHAEKLNIDPNKIALGGGSAGGHLAFIAALMSMKNEKFKPSALILFNPILNTGPTGFGGKRFGYNWKKYSPLHNLQPGLPPTLVLSGEKDKIVKSKDLSKLFKFYKEKNILLKILIYRNKEHGFFNRSKCCKDMTIGNVIDFLKEIKFINCKRKFLIKKDCYRTCRVKMVIKTNFKR